MDPVTLLKKWREDLLSQHLSGGADVMVYPMDILPDGWDWMEFDPDEFAVSANAIRVRYVIDTWVIVDASN